MVQKLDDDLDVLNHRLKELMAELQEAVDISVRVVTNDPSLRTDVAAHWESLFTTFYKHTRAKSRETGQNLLSWVSFSNITT